MLKTFIKGLAMGVCDLVPGISGGTIALLLGIYSQLMTAITNVNLRWVAPLWNYFGDQKKSDLKTAKKHLKVMNLKLLIPLGLGILLAIGLGAKVIRALIHDHPILVLSFFFGLILSAAILLTSHIKIKKDRLYGIGGIILGLAFALLIPAEIDSTWWITIVSGFLAITAMLLPGISGSYVLLLIGQYDHVLEAIELFDIKTIALFGIGAVLAFLGMSRVIHWLLGKYKHKTMMVLVGLVFGSLAVIIKQLILSWPVVGLAVLGFAIPYGINVMAKK